jgi:hypothetical protein
MTIGEAEIHMAVRKFLIEEGWTNVAGQYPGGTDELPPLNIMDPNLAVDNSPDPRRHSQNKLVPDLVSVKQNFMLIIEMKPVYSAEDEEKLKDLLTDRHGDLLSALEDLVRTRNVDLPVPIDELIFVPCLGFEASSKYQKNSDFCYFLVEDMSNVTFDGNSSVSNL